MIIRADNHTCKLLADRVFNEHSAVSVVAAVSDRFVDSSGVEVDSVVQVEHQRRSRLPAQAHAKLTKYKGKE